MMVLALYFFVSWVTTIGFIVMPKRLSFIQNTFIYLITMIISLNWYWVIYQELKLIKLSENPVDYTSFLINRSIAVPLLVVITVNMLKTYKSMGYSILILTLSASILSLLAFGGIYFNITEYIHWNYAFDFLYFLFLNIIGYLFLNLVKFLQYKEVKEQ